METVTRTSTTRTTSSLREPSADINAASIGHAAFTFEQLVQAYFDCRNSKRNSRSALAFEFNLERNLSQLYIDLISNQYTIGKSICFVITRPKYREVWAADFRDRIVHHLLYNHIGAGFERSFIADSCACIKGRGTLYAAQRLEQKIRSATQNWSQPCYYLKCDLANFFVSINKPILMGLLAKKISNPWWLQLAQQILMHDPRKNFALHGNPALLEKVPVHKRLCSQPEYRGLPIGNLSSQFFANVYLNELDQFVKHQIRALHYIRYVDDFVILHPNAAFLNNTKNRIQSFLQSQLAASLNPSKTILQPVSRGVDFVGQVIRPWHRHLRQKTLRNAMARTKSTPHAKLAETANSYFGLLRQTTHSKTQRARLSKILLLRGRCVNQNLTKTYKRNHQ